MTACLPSAWKECDRALRQGLASAPAEGNIYTGSLRSYAGTSGTGNGGNITLNSTTGDIDTTTGTLDSTSNSGNGGAVTLSAVGNVSAGNITSDSVSGNAGNIALESQGGAIDTTAGNLSALGGTPSDGSSGNRGDITTDSSSSSGEGSVSISLQQETAAGNPPTGDVTTGSISAQQVEILSDGGVTAYGNIETNSSDVNIATDVNITAIRDIVTQNITAQNGAVSLISGAGAINAIGEINSDFGLVALANQNISTNKIQSDNNVVILNSSQGAVAVNGAIASYGNVSIDALNDVVATDITSQDGAVALISGNGTVTATGAIASVEDVSLGATGDVVAQSITSAYGMVALVSTEGSVTANGEINSGLSIAILAKQNITTTDIFSEWGEVALITNQGIVTATGDIYESSFLKSNTDFVIGDASTNSTATNVSDLLAQLGPGEVKNPLMDFLVFTLEVIKEILLNPFSYDSSNVNDTNPITGKPYSDAPTEGAKERELVEQLSPGQRRRLNVIIHDVTKPDRIKEKEVFTKGEVDDHGCFHLELDRHFGGDTTHDEYADLVTGANGDYLLIARNLAASFAYYDGEVKPGAWATFFGEPSGRLAEVKTGGTCWSKVLNDQLDELIELEWRDIIQTLRELNYQIKVAQFCKRQSFISFSTEQAAEAAEQVFANKGNLSGVVHLIERLEASKSRLPGGLATDVDIAINMLQPYSVLNVLVFNWEAVRYIPDF